VPEVAKPSVKPNITMKTAYTAITLFIYLVCSQIPIYGIQRSHTADPLYWTRVILASSRGTLMELGIGPIISASWFIQIVNAIGFLKVNG
jgi:protein transport protein SEC61 subunit alpha